LFLKIDYVKSQDMGNTFCENYLVKVERWRFSQENTTDNLDNESNDIIAQGR